METVQNIVEDWLNNQEGADESIALQTFCLSKVSTLSRLLANPVVQATVSKDDMSEIAGLITALSNLTMTAVALQPSKK